MKKSTKILVIVLGVSLLPCLSLRVNANAEQNGFPVLSKAAQKTIVNELSTAINNMAQASIPVGGDTETEWAASQVDRLHNLVTGGDRPFIQQMCTLFEMNGLFAYGMNYFSSVIGTYSCPEEAGYARYAVPVCDSLANNIKATGYKDIMALADLSAYSYYYTQLYVTMLHKINGHDDFEDRDLGYSLKSLGLLRYANERGVFSQDEMVKIYFLLDAVCFYKSYYGYLMSLTYDEERRLATHTKLVEYAYYIDEVSTQAYEAIYSDEYKGLKMTNDEFEKFMLKMKDIKLDVMGRLTQEFLSISKNHS